MRLLDVGVDIHMRAHRGDERLLYKTHRIEVSPSHVGSKCGSHTFFRHKGVERNRSVEHLVITGEHHMPHSVAKTSREIGVLEIDMPV